MSNANANRFGQVLGAGDVDANFKDVFTGEILTAFQTATVTEGRHMVRNIKHGKSASFGVVGLAQAGYHVPGTEILGGNIKHTEKTIVVDGIIYSSAFVAEIDELKSAYEVRAPYSNQMGIALAKAYDNNVLRKVVQAARASALIPNELSGGTVLTDAAYRTDASKLAAGLFQAATVMDEKGVSSAGRFAYLKPSAISLLVQAKETINKNYGGDGSFSNGTIVSIAGVDIVKCPTLPTQDLSGDVAITAAGLDPAAILATYRGDYSGVAGLVAQSEAVGTVKLLDLVTAITPDERRFGTLLTARQSTGTDWLRPECAVELSVG